MIRIPEEDWLPLSAVQHLRFCRRQCALIHIEQEWMENGLTAHGMVLHERVDAGFRENRRGRKQVSGLRLGSARLGIHGRLDVLEMVQVESDAGDSQSMCVWPGVDGRWVVYPVEHKRGTAKADLCDKIQLCAQAMCLEEMFGSEVSRGFLFYHEQKHRLEVEFDEELRRETIEACRDLHDLIKSARLPEPKTGPYCKSCSLKTICQPFASPRRAAAFDRELLAAGEVTG